MKREICWEKKVLCILHFYLVYYIFSLDAFWTQFTFGKNMNGNVLSDKKIVLCNDHFCLGKYSFSLNIILTHFIKIKTRVFSLYDIHFIEQINPQIKVKNIFDLHWKSVVKVYFPVQLYKIYYLIFVIKVRSSVKISKWICFRCKIKTAKLFLVN